GEPFDLQAFRSLTIPDDRNAFVLYHQAAALLKPLKPSDPSQDRRVNVLVRWSKAAPEVRRWVEENREALALYRQGAERPDALDPSIASNPVEYVRTDSSLYSFHRMALLEASRREEQGDMAGAWDWYRTALRTIHLVGIRSTLFKRLLAQRWHQELRDQVTS